MNIKNIISPRGRDFLLYGRKKRYAELIGISNYKNTRIKSLVDNKLIGRFSCLSVSDIANITSFYNGKAYYYVMNKDIDQLHIDLLDEQETDEPNGVEVKVPIKEWNADTLNCLSFIKSVYIDNQTDKEVWKTNAFNSRKIYSYKTFKIADTNDYGAKCKVLLGLIPYTVDYNCLWDYSDDWHKSWKDTFEYVYPQINIGLLDITPNREELLYSEKTKTILRKVYDNCIAELTELWNEDCKREFTDIKDYIERVTSQIHNRLKLGNTAVPISRHLKFNTIYGKYKDWNDITENDRSSILNNFLNHEIEVLGSVYDDTLHQRAREFHWFTVKKLFRDWIDNDDRIMLALPSKVGFSGQYFKSFLSDKYPDKTILLLRAISFKQSSIKHFLTTTFHFSDLRDDRKRKFILQIVREVLTYLKGKIISTDVISSAEYIQYKKTNAIKRNKVSHTTENIVFTITDTSEDPHIYAEKYTTTLSGIIPYIHNRYKGKRVVLADLESTFTEAFCNIRYPNLIVLSAAQGRMKLLRERLPKWVRPIEELYSPDNKVLQKFAAVDHLIKCKNITVVTKRFYLPDLINSKLEKLQDYFTTYSHGAYNKVLEVVPQEKYNIEILSLYNETEKYINIGYGLNNDFYDHPLSIYLLMKAKKLKIDFGFYETIREKVNKLMNICE